MSSGCPKLIGWIDTGEENLHAKILKEKLSNQHYLHMFSKLCLLDIMGLDIQFAISQHVE